jgi:hypothetical protein
LQGAYNATTGLQNLLGQIGMPSYDTTTEWNQNMTMVLPTFRIVQIPTSQTPSSWALVTPVVASIPAGTPVIIPASTADITGGSMEQLTLSQTPRVDSTNFALSVSILNDLPSNASPVSGVLVTMIKVQFTGNFTGGVDPSSSAFYSKLPTATFAVADSWATSHNLKRDANGVPVLSINLLDENTGQWQILDSNDIQAPTSSVNGQYTYVATLPHFSVYSITGVPIAIPQGGHATLPFNAFAVQLSDYFGTRDSIPSSASGLPGQSKQVSLSDIFSVASSAAYLEVPAPVGISNTNVVEDLQEAISLDAGSTARKTLVINSVFVDVSVASVDSNLNSVTSMFVPGSVAAVSFDISNTGKTDENLTISYWYTDQSGNRVYEGSQNVYVKAGQMLHSKASIPFAAPGDYKLFVDARTASGAISTTNLDITVPFLSAYLIFVVEAVAAIVSTATGVVIYSIKSKGRMMRKSG